MTPLEVAIAVARAFEKIGAGYFLGGSMASSFQGQPRLTNDLDFVVRLRAEDIEPLKTVLGADFDVDDVALLEAVKRRGSWNIFHLPTVTRVDLFLVKDSEYDVQEFARRQPFEVSPGERIFLKSAEDSVLRKLWWFRAGGESSVQQLRDVVEIVRAQKDRLDEAYLRNWAFKLGLETLLERARTIAGAT